MGLEERVTYAVSQGANVFISIHLNALNGVGRGAEVYYPNSNYRPELGTEGEILAQQVLNQLVALGISNRGIHIRNIDDGDDPKYNYPDGSRGDYYGVIRHAKKQGIAGIIIEHCFGDNYADYNAYLNGEDKLQRLGIADANGIANAYNLQKISRDEINDFAKENKDVIKDGVYEIQSNLNNNYVLDIQNGSSYDGANVQIYESNDSTAQFWQISHDSIGYVTIKNLRTNKVLDSAGGKANNGTNIQSYSSNGSYAQKWIIEKNEDGYVIYSAVNPIYCLDVSGGNVVNGSNVQLYMSNKTDAQKWKFVTPEFYESFLDVTLHNWFYESVKYVYDNGLMTGLNETTFGPYESLARAQFAVILHRMNGSPDIEYTNKFPDVADNQWYTDAILWANEAGVVGGYTDTGKFGPGDNINREQMAVMMYRYANYLGYDTSARADISKYTDAGNVNEFAKEAMSWAVGEGIITGKYNETQLDPQGNASRAECATIIMRFMEYYN
ncbi:RICIN domain-containing protein [Faecalitalea cylindroides]|uniref:RICIN domain-containing protein n=2 Tax=Faecalitalea cylindroides TaxID=39483 RepID=UPI00232E63A8|nr:RICIN domain-containing protein [Faecalitalea cylindroides]MDB7952894.1 RICIN domain-containing protein [Faecalitalea cylindroides]